MKNFRNTFIFLRRGRIYSINKKGEPMLRTVRMSVYENYSWNVSAFLLGIRWVRLIFLGEQEDEQINSNGRGDIICYLIKTMRVCIAFLL